MAHPLSVKKNVQTYISPKLCLTPEIKSKYFRTGECVGIGETTVSEWRSLIVVSLNVALPVHVHAKHYKHNEDGRAAPGVCGNGSVSLSHSGNVVTRIGIHTHTHTHTHVTSYVYYTHTHTHTSPLMCIVTFKYTLKLP